MKSYIAVGGGFQSKWTEFRSLTQKYRSSAAGMVDSVLKEMQIVEARIAAELGAPVKGWQLLEIGPGQVPLRLLYWSARNRAVGIDLDVAPMGLNPLGYLRMLHRNGPTRLAKTLVRKAMGGDRRWIREMNRRLNAEPSLDLRQMDATNLDFRDASFDIVYSRCTFEHLSDPEQVMKEIARVLRPGGVCHLGAHLWTSDTGCHDSRILWGERGGLPRWAHLRQRTQHLVHENSYINHWRLPQWQAVIDQIMPNAALHFDRDVWPDAQEEIDRARSKGELTEYTDDELLVVGLDWVWRKPSA